MLRHGFQIKFIKMAKFYADIQLIENVIKIDKYLPDYVIHSKPQY